MMEPVSTTLEIYCGMDEFWQQVGIIADSDGSVMYPQLLTLMKSEL